MNKRSTPLLLACGLLSGGTLVDRSEAAAILTSNVSYVMATSLYHYSYSVQNTGTDDLVLVSIPVHSASAIVGISTPIGFDLTFDPVGGWINLNEDSSILTSQTFNAGSTIAPFEFNSPLAPGNVTFSAFDAVGTEFNGTIAAPVPEPTASLLGALVAVGAMLKHRRRQA